jgi:hypothetical protein
MMVAGDGETVQAVFHGGGGDVRQCSSSKKTTRSFTARSSISSLPSIVASGGGKWPLFKGSSYCETNSIDLGHYL